VKSFAYSSCTLKIAGENIKDIFQIYLCASRRLLLKIYLWTMNIFMKGIFGANIFVENIFVLELKYC
jgi:hypothetical protein